MANGNYEIGFWATLSGLIGVLIGPHLGLYKHTGSKVIKDEIIKRVENEKSVLGFPELNIADLGYYMFLKNSIY